MSGVEAIETLTVSTPYGDLRYRLEVLPAGDARRDYSDAWSWPSGAPVVSLRLTPIYAFTPFMFARETTQVDYDPSVPVLVQFSDVLGLMQERCAKHLANMLATVAGEVGMSVDVREDLRGG